MRPQQQNRRMRGRGNNRKGPNPLTRSYESNGPDVKIRGTAQQVADKYSTLARDAQSSGDRVMAENYLQHAEHYNRLIAAAQAQQPQQNQRENREDDDDEEREVSRQEVRSEQSSDNGSGPQPVLDGVPAEVALKERSGNGAAGKKPNGHAESEAKEKAEASADDSNSVANEQSTAPESSSEDSAEPAPKPVRRTRRPRAKAAASKDGSDTSEASPSAEEAAAGS